MVPYHIPGLVSSCIYKLKHLFSCDRLKKAAATGIAGSNGLLTKQEDLSLDAQDLVRKQARRSVLVTPVPEGRDRCWKAGMGVSLGLFGQAI